MTQLLSTITCPHCGFKESLEMPVDACQIAYQCPRCKKTLTPRSGDCCVFCSFGSVKCPPMQEEGA
ncbi:MAG TPA: GDCCVxC domain-containing (seleno)protein [Candidatus Bipolaricaulota bacterium]